MFETAMLPAMGNKLKALRDERGWTHEQAGEAMGVSRSQFIKLERGERRLNVDYINQAAKAFGVRPSDIIDDLDDGAIPLMGYVGAGAEIEPDNEQVPESGLDQINVPFPLPDDMIAFAVRGDSQYPVYKDGTILIVYREQRKPLEAFYGFEAAVRTRDGRRYIKTIQRGIGGVNLISWNAAPIEGVQLEWIGEIFAALPQSSLKTISKKGGIQGKLNIA